MQAINVVFDTNVLITEHRDCKEFVSELIAELKNSDPTCPSIKLALDEEGEIRREYREQLYLLSERGEIPRTLNLRRLYELIQRLPRSDHRNPRGGLIAEVTGLPPSEEFAFLSSKKCDRQIEPAMFGIVFNFHSLPDPKYTFVYLTEDFHLSGGVPRGYPNELRDIRSRYLSKNDAIRELLKTLLDSGPRPETWGVVSRILSAVRACGNVPLEGERHEFKGTVIHHEKITDTKVDTGILSDEVWEDMPKTVCSMLNKGGGYIFLGVREKPTFEVTGFTWNQHGKTEEEVQQKLVNKLRDNIFPFDPEKVKVYIVKNILSSTVPAGKMIIAIHVQRKSRDEEYYRANGCTGKKNSKKYHARAIWSRCASEVQMVPEK